MRIKNLLKTPVPSNKEDWELTREELKQKYIDHFSELRYWILRIIGCSIGCHVWSYDDSYGGHVRCCRCAKRDFTFVP